MVCIKNFLLIEFIVSMIKLVKDRKVCKLNTIISLVDSYILIVVIDWLLDLQFNELDDMFSYNTMQP